jgi:hypothetical protein
MSEVPKIVYDRLRTAPPESDPVAKVHPDANLLTAFAEQSISALEREDVLHHLALCGDCRETVHIAWDSAWDSALEGASAGVDSTPVSVSIESAPVRPTSIPLTPKKNWWPRLAWPNLGWAGLAAGAALAASLLVLHPAKKNQPTQSAISHPVNTNMSPAADSQVVSSSSNPSTAISQSDKPQSVAASTLSGKENTHTSSRFAARSAHKKRPTNSPRSDEVLMARNDAPPIEKAKPALPSEETQSTGAQAQASGDATQPVTWAIVSGALRRSSDAGNTWQIALRADRSLLSYASRGQDVWAGGEAGALFHSTDGGVSWTQVHPSMNDGLLNSDITQIDLPNSDLSNRDLRNSDSPKNDSSSDTPTGRQNSQQIVVSTGTSEVWSSTDGGKTWTKR